MTLSPSNAAPASVVQVLPAAALRVTSGANLGDTLADCDGLTEELSLGDIYRLAPDTAPTSLSLAREADAPLVIAATGDTARAGDPVGVCARLTLLPTEGHVVDLLLLRVGLDSPGFWLLPLSPLLPRRDYTLIRLEADPKDVPLADIACASVARGTRITRADGSIVAVEALEAGDRILTRDHGPQALRWLGRVTLRAEGSFAPVVIRAGTLGNLGDLALSQQHRLFLYLRDRIPGIPTAEVLVEARHLVDNRRIFIREGGFVDYFSLVFDRHEVVYAEGLPTESLRLAAATRARLPGTLADDLRDRFPDLAQHQHFGTEAAPQLADLLRQRLLPPED